MKIFGFSATQFSRPTPLALCDASGWKLTCLTEGCISQKGFQRPPSFIMARLAMPCHICVVGLFGPSKHSSNNFQEKGFTP